MKEELKEYLSEMVDGIIYEDGDKAIINFHEYLTTKIKQLL